MFLPFFPVDFSISLVAAELGWGWMVVFFSLLMLLLLHLIALYPVALQVVEA
jgi:hypothetical protein